MHVNLVVYDPAKPTFDNGQVARKKIWRDPGFFAFPGMTWNFEWEGGNVVQEIIGVQHEEKYGSMTLTFMCTDEIKRAVNHQNDWQVFGGGKLR